MTGLTVLWSLLALLCTVLPSSAAQGSCVGRCGEQFSRGHICNCDYNCFVHGECCKDFEDICTASESCRGRCGEPFRRGRQCECDSGCVLHNSCCPDYSTHCDAFSHLQAPRSSKPNKPADYTEECIAACLAAQQNPDVMRYGSGLNNLMTPSASPFLAGDVSQDGPYTPLSASDIPGLSSSPSEFHLAESDAAAPLQPAGASSENPQAVPVQVSLSISGQADRPSSSSGRPSIPADIAQAPADSSPAGPGLNLCSGVVIDGMAALFNGSIIVFRGHFFWLLNPKTRRAGPARRITEELGVPSPIDTAFTRCNCQGKTYIIKGDSYWSFENGVLESGYPRSVSQDFGGLSGDITAALPVPATRKRPESVYFFKKGGKVQKLSFPPGSGPNCSGKRSKNADKPSKNGKQAEIQLSGEINIKLKMKGFPSAVSSAVSMPNPRKSDGFDYLVFSWPKVLNVKISGDLPALTAPASHSSQQNDITKWLHCA
ncbi:proteoglycan 4a isoform X1 [Danio rerio]|uniref:Proteoglycan 4a n=7 Tax=Danio rerio TaxID=7955 RepID=A0A8M1PHS8_DANRE|nr:proteoglycan 4a precursor [Danio rerio]XP_005163421.1 proteoglycan 4 isoform X1 [Danio rerio]|eukprot:NP_997918.2 proteoglycan 4 precursor [Danio rerio]